MILIHTGKITLSLKIWINLNDVNYYFLQVIITLGLILLACFTEKFLMFTKNA